MSRVLGQYVIVCALISATCMLAKWDKQWLRKTQSSLCITMDARSGLTGSSLCCLPRNLLYLFGPALRHVSTLLDSVDSTVSFSSRCLCNMQNRRSAILVSITFTLLGLKAAWYLCKMTDFVTYLALLVKCRSYKDATNYNPLAQWQAFRPRTPWTSRGA